MMALLKYSFSEAQHHLPISGQQEFQLQLSQQDYQLTLGPVILPMRMVVPLLLLNSSLNLHNFLLQLSIQIMLLVLVRAMEMQLFLPPEVTRLISFNGMLAVDYSSLLSLQTSVEIVLPLL